MTCNCDNDGSNEYIIELNQQGAPGIKGEQGEQGYSPIVDYTSNNNALQLHIVNEQNTVTTPEIPLKSYTDTQLAGKLNKDGSNAGSNFTINGISLKLRGANSGEISTSNYLYLDGYTVSIGDNSYSVSIGNRDNASVDINYADTFDIFNGYSTALHGYQGIMKVKSPLDNSLQRIATVDQIPTVGNGTITLTQDGVTKGTFTTNQSGNTTIDLDSGVTNPLVVQNSNSNGYAKLYGQGAYAFDTSSGGVFATQWTETVDDVEHTYTRTLSLSNGGRYRTKPYIQYEYKDDVGGSGTSSITDLGFLNVGGGNFAPLSIGSFGGGYKYILNYNTDTLGLDTNNKLTVKVMTGSDSITGGAAGLVPAPSAGDQDKFLKGDGTWDTVGGGGSSYTEGTGIDITNDTISIDTSVVAQLSDIPDVSNFVTNSSLATTLTSYVQSSSLGSAAYTSSSDYATSIQGGKADTAMQPNSNDSITGTKEFTTGTAQFNNGSKLEVRGQSTLFLRGNSVAHGAYLGLGLRGNDSTNNVTINQMYFTANNNSDIATLRLDGLNLSKSPYIYNGYTRLGQISVTNSNINFATGTGTALQYNGSEIATVNDIPDVSELQEKLTAGTGINLGSATWQTPIMTSSSQDGFVITESQYNAQAGWCCFDGQWNVPDAGWWTGNDVVLPCWVEIELPNAQVPTEWIIKNEIETPANFKDAKLQGSNNDSTWDDLYTISNRPDTAGYQETYNISTSTAYKYLRIYITSAYGNSVSIQQMQINGIQNAVISVDTGYSSSLIIS